MPIIFIHGVNNRVEDPSFIACRKARHQFVRELIGKEFSQHPSLADLKDVEWGNLGVTFAWDKKSLPEVDFESFGAEEEALELPEIPVTSLSILLAGLSQQSDSEHPTDDGFEAFGDAAEPGLFRALAKTAPEDFFKNIASPLSESLADAGMGIKPWACLDPNCKPEQLGVEAANMIMAAHKLAQSPQELTGDTDAEVMESSLRALLATHEGLATKPGLGDGFESYGISEFSGWVKRTWRHATQLADRGRRAATSPKRAASVLALRAKRESLSSHAFVFLGDIFEYFRRGQGHARWEDGSILNSVKEQIDSIVADSDEPLVVITHSFGGEVFYELLTCGAFEDLKVDLWVTVGSQVGLFAEMRMFRNNPENVPGSGGAYLSRPPQVAKWINVFDPVDVFSFRCAPVFGDDVQDHRFRGGNVATAHGEYLFRPEFYELVANEIVVEH